MTRSLILFAIGLFFGGGFGYVAASSSCTSPSGHDHADPAARTTGMAQGAGDMNGSGMDPSAMDHGLPDASPPVPGVQIVSRPDSPGAVNPEIPTTDFRFAPEHVNGPAAPGAGHAPVFVDGVKIVRTYGLRFRITGVSGGEELRVTLNADPKTLNQQIRILLARRTASRR